jgi:hypothetical protein
MIGLFCFVLAVLASPFKSKLRLEAENAVLRHQLIVLRRRLHGRVRLTNRDRWFLVRLYRWFPAILQVLTIIRPETLVRWHRTGFRCYWRWKSRPQGGRPQIATELRGLIRRMSAENPLWGAPRIHGELLKLGFEVAQLALGQLSLSQLKTTLIFFPLAMASSWLGVRLVRTIDARKFNFTITLILLCVSVALVCQGIAGFRES